MRSIVLRSIIFIFFLIITAIIIRIQVTNNGLFVAKCIGEGDNWSVELNIEEYYDVERRLVKTTEYTLFYKGDPNDLCEIKLIRAKSKFADLGQGHKNGFKSNNIRLKSESSGGINFLSKKMLKKFKLTVYWADDESLKETFDLFLVTKER